jgi:hypothetical protein
MRGGLRPGLRAANRTRKPVNSRRLDYGAAGVTRSTSRQVLPNRARCLTDYYAKFQACDRSSRSAALELTAAVSSIIRASAFWKRAFSFCLLLLLLLHLQLLVGPFLYLIQCVCSLALAMFNLRINVSEAIQMLAFPFFEIPASRLSSILFTWSLQTRPDSGLSCGILNLAGAADVFIAAVLPSFLL